jgi:hypothetical protein
MKSFLALFQPLLMAARNLDSHLDVFIKQKDDYYVARCLQLDLVTTSKTIAEIQKYIIDLWVARIMFLYEYDNIEYLT